MTSNSTKGGDLTLTHIATALLAFQSILIIATNSVVFVLFAKFRQLRRKSNYCLVGLATSDFLAGVIVFPLFAVCNYVRSPESCISFHIMQRFLIFSVILHLLLATSDRCLKIAFPLRYRTLVTEARVVAVLLVIWLSSLGVSLSEVPLLSDARNNQIYSTTVLVVLACIPFGIILSLNTCTRWLIISMNKKRANLVKTERNKDEQKKQQQIVCVYLTMAVISFLLGVVLYFVFRIVKIPNWLTVVMAVLKYCTHFINPIMYTFFKEDFRRAFKRLFQKEEMVRRDSSFESKETNF